MSLSVPHMPTSSVRTLHLRGGAGAAGSGASMTRTSRVFGKTATAFMRGSFALRARVLAAGAAAPHGKVGRGGPAVNSARPACCQGSTLGATRNRCPPGRPGSMRKGVSEPSGPSSLTTSRAAAAPPPLARRRCVLLALPFLVLGPYLLDAKARVELRCEPGGPCTLTPRPAGSPARRRAPR